MSDILINEYVCMHACMYVCMCVWSGRTCEKNTCCGFLGVPFKKILLYSSAHAEPAQVDRFSFILLPI